MTFDTEAIVILVIFILPFWQRATFLYIIAAPVAVGYGLSWFDRYNTPVGMIVSLALLAIGFYFGANAIAKIVGRE